MKVNGVKGKVWEYLYFLNSPQAVKLCLSTESMLFRNAFFPPFFPGLFSATKAKRAAASDQSRG